MKQKKLSGRALVIQLAGDELRLALMTLGASPRIQQCRTLPLPRGAVEDGLIRDADALRDTLKAALGEPAYKRRKRVVFSICSTQIIPETVTVPALGPKKMEKLLRSNMDLYFPVNAGEYHMVWEVTGETAGREGGKEASVQLWAVPNTLLAGYYALANGCGLSVAAIDYCGNSLAAAVGASFSAPAKAVRSYGPRGERKPSARRKGGEAETATAVMDPPEAEELPEAELYLLAEREYLLMTFAQGGQVKLQRLLPCAADPGGALSEALMVLEYYSSMEAGRYSGISGVLCGALAEDAAFLAAVEEILDLPVRVLDCAQGPAWCVCLGAARTALDFGVPAMDQRGGAGRQLAQAWQYGLVLVGGALLAASLLLTFGSRASRQAVLDGLRATAQSLELQAAKISGNADRYERYEAAYESYEADWDDLFGTGDRPGALRTYNDNLVLALEELENTLPKTARVVTFGIAQQGLGLQIACASKEDAAYTIIALRDLQYAELSAISNLSYGSGLDARQVLSALTGASEEELAAALGGAGTGEAAPAEGSQLDISSLLGMFQQSSDRKNLLEQAIAGGAISRDDLEDALDHLDGDQLEILEAIYGAHTTRYDLEDLLEDATFQEREEALRTMLTRDPIAMGRFAVLLRADMDRSEPILFRRIVKDLLRTVDVRTLGAAVEGDMSAMMEIVPALLEIITEDEENLEAAEALIMTDEELSSRLAYYLAKEMDLPDKSTGGSIDVDGLLNDIIHGTLPSTPESGDAADILAGLLPELFPQLDGSGSREMQDWFRDHLLGGTGAGETWDVVWSLLDDADRSPGTAIDPSENAEYSLDDKYYITVALKYKEDLIRAELERKGLAYDDKAAKLEVNG